MAEEKAGVDILKELLGLNTDSELAQRLGYSKQAIATARHRRRISDKMVAVAAGAAGISRDELKNLLPDSSSEADEIPSRLELWEELKKCHELNRRLIAENHRLVDKLGKMGGS